MEGGDVVVGMLRGKGKGVLDMGGGMGRLDICEVYKALDHACWVLGVVGCLVGVVIVVSSSSTGL